MSRHVIHVTVDFDPDRYVDPVSEGQTLAEMRERIEQFILQEYGNADTTLSFLPLVRGAWAA